MKKENKLKRLWNYFSVYEKVWFFSIIALSVLIACLYPESDTNGINGVVITIMYLIDTILCIVCELLTSKQSKWSFFIYIFVEVIEIAVLIMIKARFATMAVALLFWTPMHIISFINWNKHPDKNDESLTVVRSLKWWQSLLTVLLILVWTLGIGYLVARFSPDTEFFSSEAIKRFVAYFDACCSAVSIANGILLFFRYKENWLAWYLFTFMELAINIITGQWILLVLKLGYLTNTTYGYIKWTKYIKSKQSEKDVSEVKAQEEALPENIA